LNPEASSGYAERIWLHWFQQTNVPWVEPVDVAHVAGQADRFKVTLADGENLVADRVIVAIGLTCFAYVPPAIASLPPALAVHTSQITNFAAFKGRDVAVIGAGQSALEAAAILHEAGARPQLLVREGAIGWMSRVPHSRSLWRRLRSPISSLGSGPKAWALAQRTDTDQVVQGLLTSADKGHTWGFLPPAARTVAESRADTTSTSIPASS